MFILLLYSIFFFNKILVKEKMFLSSFKIRNERMHCKLLRCPPTNVLATIDNPFKIKINRCESLNRSDSNDLNE